MTKRPTYRLVLVDEGRPNARGYRHPAPRRLAILLRFALRACGFRCLDAVEVADMPSTITRTGADPTGNPDHKGEGVAP